MIDPGDSGLSVWARLEHSPNGPVDSARSVATNRGENRWRGATHRRVSSSLSAVIAVKAPRRQGHRKATTPFRRPRPVISERKRTGNGRGGPDRPSSRQTRGRRPKNRLPGDACTRGDKRRAATPCQRQTAWWMPLVRSCPWRRSRQGGAPWRRFVVFPRNPHRTRREPHARIGQLQVETGAASDALSGSCYATVEAVELHEAAAASADRS